jgi:hypothetical protein
MNTQSKKDKFFSVFGTNTYGADGICGCGVAHYDEVNKWDSEYHDIELPNAKERAKKNPQDYQFHDTAIDFININGALYVRGCRCKTDEMLFDFLNEDREQVIAYLKETQDVLTVDDLAQPKGE